MNYNDFSYANVPDEIIDAAAKETERTGYALELIWYKSDNAQDSHLFNVVASNKSRPNEENKFTKWMYNSSTNSLNHGHYNLTEEKALTLLQEHTETNKSKTQVSYSQPKDIVR